MTGGITSPGAGWRQAEGGPSTQRTTKRRRRGGGRGRNRGEVAMVDDVEFTSYYGRQIVKTPTWKNPEVPLYLFLGGAAGTSSVLAALAEFTDRPTLARNGLAPADLSHKGETGGLSGRPLTRRAREVVAFVHRETGGRLPVIGVGGIMTPDDAARMFDAGASLIQLYTGFIYGGPALVRAAASVRR